MTDPNVQAVRRNFVLYGHIWHDPERGWVGSKVGEFGTERSGYETEQDAYKWVLTNAAISDDDARGEDVEDVAS